MQNVWKLRTIRLVTTDKRRGYLVSGPTCHTTKWFWENLLIIEVNQIKVKLKIGKTFYLGLPILEIRKTIINELGYYYIKPKYGHKMNWCYINTDRFIKIIKTEGVYKDIANEVEKGLDTSNYENELN